MWLPIHSQRFYSRSKANLLFPQVLRSYCKYDGMFCQYCSSFYISYVFLFILHPIKFLSFSIFRLFLEHSFVSSYLVLYIALFLYTIFYGTSRLMFDLCFCVLLNTINNNMHLFATQNTNK
jgi:hypothetical protein